jgi:hypothetical protein
MSSFYIADNIFDQNFTTAIRDELTISSISSRDKITLQNHSRPNVLHKHVSSVYWTVPSMYKVLT